MFWVIDKFEPVFNMMMQILKSIYKEVLRERTRNNIYFFLFKLRAIRYRGNTMTCNCCEKSFTRFLSFGHVKRENAACPNCLSLERTRLLLFYLQKETTFFSEHLKVLHFAPERILEKRFVKLKNLSYLTVDINPERAMEKADIMDLHFKDNTFDVLFCSHILMMISDEKKALRELFRVLKPGGFALIQTRTNTGYKNTFTDPKAITDEQRRIAYGESELYRVFGDDFADYVSSFGFNVQSIPYGKILGEDVVRKYGLGNNEIIFRCTK